jgi:hypothetical protein
MHRPKPNKLHDELDALLDGRPVELTDELAPLVEAADVLRIELAAYQLDPRVADRHLERVLERPGTVVQLPVRQRAGGWDVRRRVVAVALAAALVLAPATIASAAALPGQAMYPFKLAIEQVRIASVQWSPSREASERTRVADERLDEVQSLFRLQMFTQLPGALRALEQAVVAAQAAVAEAREEGEPVGKVESQLTQVRAGGGQVVEQVRVAAASGSFDLTGDTRKAVQAAVEQSQDVLRPPPNRDTAPTGGTPTPTTTGGSANPPPPATEPPPPNTAPPPPSTTVPPPTNAPPTNPPPTTVPTTTVPQTTEPETPDSAADQQAGGSGKSAGPDKKAPGEKAPGEKAPPTSAP